MIDFSFRRFLAEARLVYVGGEPSDVYDDEGESPDYYGDAYKLASVSGINILRNMELEYVALEGQQVVGALWCGRQGEDFSFDVVVDKAFQRRGIGRQLIDAAISTFNSDFRDVSEDARILAHVVNPVLVPLLLSMGFVEINPGYPHTGKYLQYPPPDPGGDEEEG